MSTTKARRRARTVLCGLAAATVAAGLSPTGIASAQVATPPVTQSTDAFCAGVAADFDTFEDIAGNPFQDDILCLAWADITWGAGPGDISDPRDVYLPLRTITRGQMATLLTNTMDAAWYLDPAANINELLDYEDVETFTDVPYDHPHYYGITRLAEAGIALGGPGSLSASQFGPGLPVTRAQMATFIARSDAFMRGRAVPTAPDYFTDDDANTHQPRINALASLGIAGGIGGGEFAPGRPVTRGQMAAFLVRTLAKLHADGLIDPVWDLLDVPDEAFSTVTAVDNQDGTATLTFTLRNYEDDPILGLGAGAFGLLRLDTQEMFVDELIASDPGAWAFTEVGGGVYEVVHTSAVDTTFVVDLVFANMAFLAQDLTVTVTSAV